MDPSIECQICGAIAKRNLKHYKHYEAICCLGCKAFFRRYVRGINQTTLECKASGRCDLTIGRTACKECRFRRCLQVGMDASKVLNEDDRKKYTHPRKKKPSGSNDQQICPNCVNCTNCQSFPTCQNCPNFQSGSNYLNQDGGHYSHQQFVVSDYDHPTPSTSTTDVQLQTAQISKKRSIQSDSQYGSKRSSRILSSPEPCGSHDVPRDIPLLLPIQSSSAPTSAINRSVPLLIQDVQNIFYEILAKVNHPPFMVDHLVAGHSNNQSWNATHSQVFLQMIDINIPIIYHFAHQNPLFKEVNQSDQKLLLNK